MERRTDNGQRTTVSTQRSLIDRVRTLEDRLLKRMQPWAYLRIKRYMDRRGRKRQDVLATMQEAIERTVASEMPGHFDPTGRSGPVFFVESRAKNVYSIHRKMQRTGKSLRRIYDMLGIRLICGDVGDSYRLLALVHRLWQPVPGRFKDYVVNPKPNGYRALHTTVRTANGDVVEIQIRTFGMHAIAELGSADHATYKAQETVDVSETR
ncbi:MAG: hypothetical protein ACQETQ_12485 [Spirochaetota bacterium]